MIQATMATQLELPTINPNEIVAYKSTPVVTTRMLADYYRVEPKQIQNNFARNRNRFSEGKHYFKIDGEELKSFHLSTSQRGSQISKKARVLILWTDRGAFRHAKMINTDEAWDVYEFLEESYFERYAKDLYREASKRARQARLEWQKTRRIGIDDGRKPLCDVVQAFHLMYGRQKSKVKPDEGLQPESRFFENFTKLAYSYAFDNYPWGVKTPAGFRDRLSQEELKRVTQVERVLRLMIVREIGRDRHYKEAFVLVKQALDDWILENPRIICNILPKAIAC